MDDAKELRREGAYLVLLTAHKNITSSKNITRKCARCVADDYRRSYFERAVCSLFAATVTRWLSESSGQVTLWRERGREGGKDGSMYIETRVKGRERLKERGGGRRERGREVRRVKNMSQSLKAHQ